MKLLVPEPGAAEVAQAWMKARRRVSSLLLYPEARGAVARARRMGRLDATTHATARRRIEAFWLALDRVELTDELVRRSGDLSERYLLRAHDAVHLASLEHAADPELVLISADADLLDAAQSMGFATIRPS